MLRFRLMLVSLAVLVLQSKPSTAFAEEVMKTKISWPEASAVAWQTKKTMFLFSSSEPIGMSTKLTAKLEAIADQRVLSLSVPVASFDSGEKDRDADIVKILKADKHPNIEFKTPPMSILDLEDVINGNVSSLKGDLSIGGQKFPVQLLIMGSGPGPKAHLIARLEAKFSTFNIEPPSVAGGLVASVDDLLWLHGKLFLSDIEGFAFE